MADREENEKWRPEGTGRRLRVVTHEHHTSQHPSVRKIKRIVNYVFMIIEGLIALRMILKGLGGNPGNAFVSLIYSITDVIVGPFLTAFNYQTFDTGYGVFEFGALLAVAFYILLNYAIGKLLLIMVSRN